MEIRYSEHCAWRAFYVYNSSNPLGRRQIFSLGIDPEHTRPRLFGNVGRKYWRIPLPRVSWIFATRYRKVGGLFLYRVFSRFYRSLDGRRY